MENERSPDVGSVITTNSGFYEFANLNAEGLPRASLPIAVCCRTTRFVFAQPAGEGVSAGGCARSTVGASGVQRQGAVPASPAVACQAFPLTQRPQPCWEGGDRVAPGRTSILVHYRRNRPREVGGNRRSLNPFVTHHCGTNVPSCTGVKCHFNLDLYGEIAGNLVQCPRRQSKSTGMTAQNERFHPTSETM